MKALVEVNHLRADLCRFAILEEVLLHLPVEGSLEGVFDTEGAAFDKKSVLENIGDSYIKKCADTFRHL